jgi:hypothetical protein
LAIQTVFLACLNPSHARMALTRHSYFRFGLFWQVTRKWFDGPFMCSSSAGYSPSMRFKT